MNNEKRISDMYFAAVLLAYGVEIKSVDASNPRKQEFIFMDAPMTVFKRLDYGVSEMEIIDIDMAYMMFTSKTLMVSASAFADALRSIKSLIYANKC